MSNFVTAKPPAPRLLKRMGAVEVSSTQGVYLDEDGTLEYGELLLQHGEEEARHALDGLRSTASLRSLLPTARFYRYSIFSFNVKGLFPLVPGVPPIRSAYSDTQLIANEDGSLGRFEFTRRPQLLTQDEDYPIHRAFIPTNVSQLEFHPNKHLIRLALQTVTDTHKYRISSSWIVPVLQLMRSLFITTVLLSGYCWDERIGLPSVLDADWHFGDSWWNLLSQLRTWQPLSRILFLG